MTDGTHEDAGVWRNRRRRRADLVTIGLFGFAAVVVLAQVQAEKRFG